MRSKLHGEEENGHDRCIVWLYDSCRERKTYESEFIALIADKIRLEYGDEVLIEENNSIRHHKS